MAKYVTGKWDLSGLVPNPKTPAFTKQILELEKKSKQFTNIKSSLKPKISSKKFLEILHKIEDIDEKMCVIGGYSSLAYAADTQSDEATALLTKMNKLGADISNRMY